MAMYLSNHPDDDDEMVNRVEAFDPPHPSPGSRGTTQTTATSAGGGWV
jgi:hypothetical protein